MNRKSFLHLSSFIVLGISKLGFVKSNSQGDFIGDCNTTSDILGPFYRAQSPLRSDLTFPLLEGIKITIKGQIFGEDCTTLLQNALIEIWHCDTQGNYDNDSPQYLHRGSQITNKDGKYSFHTILPGKYLNGKLYRPAHIHFRITKLNYKELVSQIYFLGDPHIEEDPWASQPDAQKRILSLVPHDTNGNLNIHFDIFLST